MTGSLLPPKMPWVSHVKNVCVQSSADVYQRGLERNLTQGSWGVTMNKEWLPWLVGGCVRAQGEGEEG